MGGSPSAAVKPAAASTLRLRALARLWHALETALEVAASAWEFACQLPDLRADGVTDTDLRWLLKRGYAEHRLETTAPGQRQRRFRPSPNGRFRAESCFVLTPAGRAYAHTLPLDGILRPADRAPAPPPRPAPAHPRWDADRRILWLGNILVKQFRLAAKNQELLLAAFEEEGWPIHIDDPLPPRPGVDSKRRLHDTINRLNRHQRRQAMRFQGDGTGCGIRWLPVSGKRQRNGTSAAPPPH